MIGHITVTDINYVLASVLPMLQVQGKPHTASSLANARATIEWPGVFITEYLNPSRNVLFDPVRDANPFFHFLESMWILAGRRDVAFLQWVLPSIAKYSDDQRVFHGAYGYRLRKAMGFDQVESAIEVLSTRPTSRQVVMQIWNSKSDLDGNTNDVPCNDLVMCKIRDGKLNITVNNRSNDAVLGAYGANVVQFSMLQMYMAARLGVGVGRYTQVSDSMHVYEDTPYWQKFVEGKLPPQGQSPYDGIGDTNMFEKNVSYFEQELKWFFEAADKAIAKPHDLQFQGYTQVIHDAACIFNSLRAHRDRRHEDAGRWADEIIASDWHLACTAWLNRRVQAALEKVKP
jgi:hypothetical protein